MNDLCLWWVGVRISEIRGVEHLLSGAVSIIGESAPTELPFISLERKLDRRPNHNAPSSGNLIDGFLETTLADLKQQQPEAKFFHQDQLNFYPGKTIPDRTVFNNELNLIKPLKDKALCRSLMGRHIPTIESSLVFASEVSYEALRELFPSSSSFIIQEPTGAGGLGTVLIQNVEDEQYLRGLSSTHLVASAYKDGMLPVNQHLVLFPETTVVLPSSAQIVEKDEKNRMTYKGCDFFLRSKVPSAIRDALDKFGNVIGQRLRANGYRGVVGVDYLVSESEVFFVELNPRFQYSTTALNQGLRDQGLPSVHEMHIAAFRGEAPPDISSGVPISRSSVIVTKSRGAPVWSDLKPGHQRLQSPDCRDTPFSKDSIEISVDLDGLDKKTKLDPGAIIGRLDLNRPAVSYGAFIGTSHDPSLMRIGRPVKPLLRQAAGGNQAALAQLKFHLFSYGMKILDSARKRLEDERNCLTIRDGIAGGLEVLLPQRIHVNVPVKEYFALFSPYRLNWHETEESFFIEDVMGNTLGVEVLPIPDFADKTTSRGTPMVDVGQMFNERLSIEVFFGCVNNEQKATACHFCELGAEPDQKYALMEDITELVAYCEKTTTIPMRHVLIGGGTPPEPNWGIYFEALKAVKRQTNLPVYMMIAPPNNLDHLATLKNLGADELGMNIEIFDRSLARRYMPAKGKLSLNKYFAALERAVDLWGNTGSVRSILIVGLEPLESTLSGVEALCERGVMPILSPFRPIPSTPLANHPPPSADLLYTAWREGQNIADRHGLALGPQCVACQNNTIAMPFGAAYRYY